MKNKRAAMEMTVGTIVTIVLLMSALVLGLILTKTIFKNTTDSVNSINDQMKTEINDLFEQDESKSIIVGLGGESTATVKQGTESFGIPFAFSPTNPQIWGSDNKGCLYNIEVAQASSSDACTKNGWTNPTADVFPGVTNQRFDEVYSNNGFALLKVSIPESIPPCTQRFQITVKCSKDTSETSSSFFDIKVVKRGL
jgi:hypothetical protein